MSSDEFYFSVDIPWPKYIPWYHNTWTWYKSWLVSKNKSVEVQVECDWDILFEFSMQWNRREDHAGFGVTLAFLRHWIDINFRDNRHWNHDKNRWYTDADHDDIIFTEEEARTKIIEIAHKIKSGIKDDEVKILLEELPHSEMKYALLGKLAEWQYSTEVNRVAKILWEPRFEEAWWIDRTGPKKAK